MGIEMTSCSRCGLEEPDVKFSRRNKMCNKCRYEYYVGYKERKPKKVKKTIKIKIDEYFKGVGDDICS